LRGAPLRDAGWSHRVRRALDIGSAKVARFLVFSKAIAGLGVVVLCTLGCSDDGGNATSGSGGDAAAGAGGAGASGGTGGASAGGASAGGAAGCTGDCTLDLTMDFGAVGKLDEAYYGLIAPSQSYSGDWEIAFRAQRSDVDGCPSAEQLPLQILSLSNLPATQPTSTLTKGDLEVAGFYDSIGEFSTNPALEATEVTITPKDWSVCTTCGSVDNDPNGYVAFDLEMTFPTGTISGSVYATHCASMNQL
jgi:hypothetical protein